MRKNQNLPDQNSVPLINLVFGIIIVLIITVLTLIVLFLGCLFGLKIGLCNRIPFPPSSSTSEVTAPTVVTPTITMQSPPMVASIYPPLKIAYVVRSLGDQAGSGMEQSRGFELAEQYFLDQGLDIDLVPKASGNFTQTIEEFEKLGKEAEENNFLAIAGPTFSAEAEVVVSRVINIPVLGISNTKQELIDLFASKGITNYVRVSAPVMSFVPFALSGATKIYSGKTNAQQIRNIAIIYDERNSFTISEASAYQRSLKESYAGTKVVSTTFGTGDTDFTAQITSILTPTNAQPPDLVIVSGLIREGGIIVKELKKQGYLGVIIGGNGLNVPDITDYCGNDCSEMIVAQSYNYNLQPEGNEEFKERYRKKYNLTKEDYPTQFAAQAFAAVQVIVQSLEKLDNQEKKRGDGTGINNMSLHDLRLKLNEILHSGETFSTVLGDIKITAQGEVEQDDFAWSIFRHGKFIIEE